MRNRRRIRSLAPSAGDRHTVDIVWTQQPDGSTCAPTVVQMILRAYGIELSVDSLKGPIGWNPDSGTSRYGVADALNAFQRGHTYRVSNSDDATRSAATVFAARRHLLVCARREVAAGHPVAVALAGILPGYPGPLDHWVVVTGVDGAHVRILDPAVGRHGFEHIPPTRWLAVDHLPIKAFVA